MAYPEKLKNELVLCFRFKRIVTAWRRSGGQPVVLRVATQNCSQEYREPKLLGNIQDGFVDVRIYDDQGIDITNESTLLGDWSFAEKRCEDFLEPEVKKTLGHESDRVERSPDNASNNVKGVANLPSVSGVLETAIYVADLATAIEFYQRIFGFEILDQNDRLCALNVGGRSVLLLFRQGASKTPTVFSGGTLPAHDAKGSTHFAFAINAKDLANWEKHLTSEGIAIESRVHWSRGGRSIYFRDPDDHLLELATPGVWATY